jgi:hypothetical protein
MAGDPLSGEYRVQALQEVRETTGETPDAE